MLPFSGVCTFYCITTSSVFIRAIAFLQYVLSSVIIIILTDFLTPRPRGEGLRGPFFVDVSVCRCVDLYRFAT
jgi:hypothetical protein